jgi:H+/gluconate symporter-like permease
MGRTWRLLMAVAVVGLLLAAPVVSASAHTDQVQVQAAPSPSPTLGSTESPPPNPPGSTNASPKDYNGAWLVVVAVLAVAVIVGAGTFYMTRRARGFDMSPRSEPEDDKTHSHSRSDRNN